MRPCANGCLDDLTETEGCSNVSPSSSKFQKGTVYHLLHLIIMALAQLSIKLPFLQGRKAVVRKYSFFDIFFQKFLFGNLSVQSYLKSLENQTEHPKHDLINTVHMIDIVSSHYAPRSNSDL